MTDATKKPRTRKPRINDTVRTTRYIDSPICKVPTGTAAVVVATGSGRFQIEPIGLGGLVRVWCDADYVEAA